MRYGILGPLEVKDAEGGPVALGGRTERVLLACLLLEANRVVSADRLIDALWGEEPPETAGNALQVHVSKLRRKLSGPSGADGPLETSSPGYVLRTAPGELDSERFESLATSTVADEVPAQTSARLAEALALWRGPVLAGLENEISAQTDIARLEGLRISATQRRIEADLALGRHAQLVGELEGLVASNPLHEALRGQLMVALYRSGRQADALSVYRDTRQVLAEELGIDPSPALQELELAVLNQSPELDAPVEQAEFIRSAKQPSGTVTFLFSDIEGSTVLLRRLGEESYAHVLADHHRLIRSALAAHEGTEVDTQGDGFFAVFSSSRACVASVIEMQRSLASHEWPSGEQIRVRMGIHAGEAAERTTGLVGFDVHKAARVAAAAHGGQVLLSETASALVRDFLPEDALLRDLGLHRLKDLGRPEQIFQLDIEGLGIEFPPIRSLDNPELENNLPAQLSSFVGREAELSEISVLVETSRLVTLTGAGGSGKTRLALQVAAELLDGSGEGVWFVDLAPLSDPGLVAATVAHAMGVREESGRPVADTLMHAIGDRRLLILLDNCEHLIDSCAKLTDALLRSCPRIHVLATSREPLAIGGEHIYRVPTLSLPQDDDQAAAGSEAVQLFLERASESRPDFILDDRNSKVVASICRRLDGMPLAIELAAARVASMDVTDIESRLDKRFALLSTTSRSVLPRQQTLRALVDWSYDLLTVHERETLCRLSVFAGGWSLSAAEAACASEDESVFDVADLLRSLVDKSLVQAEMTSLGLRYRLLETIRQFAAEKLAERPGDDLAVRHAHKRFFLELAERTAPNLRGPEQAEWLDRLEADHDNFRATIERLLADPDTGSEILRIVVALSRFFEARHPREGLEVLEAALSLDVLQGRSALRAEALGLLGDLMEGRERRLYIEEGLAIARTLDDPGLTAQLLTWLSWCAYQEGDLVEFSELAEQAVVLAKRSTDPALLGRALARRAVAAGHLDPEDAAPASEMALASLRLAGDRRWEANVLCNLASFEVIADKLESARDHYSQALVIVEELRDKSGVTVILAGMGEVAMLGGDLNGARELYSRALRCAYRDRERRGAVYLVLNLAQCYTKIDGEERRAAILFGAADAQNELLGLPWEIGVSQERDRSLDLLRRSIDVAVFDSLYAEGRDLTLDAAVSLALRA